MTRSMIALVVLASTCLPRIGLADTAIAVAAGGESTCALTAGGAVQCWSNQDPLTPPVPVTVPGLERGVKQVAAGNRHTCALTELGVLQCWGSNQFGQLGDGTTTDRATPVVVVGLAGAVAAVTAGHGHTCALTTDGAVQCWGANSSGQLGDGTNTGRLTPGPVMGLVGGATAVAAGWSHTCALNADGAVQCWGANSSGQLGDGTVLSRPMPSPVVGLETGVATVAGGGSHSCALMTYGAVKCWGRNVFGELGDGTTTSRPIPRDVAGLTRDVLWVAVGGTHACAVRIGGAVQCWGYNAAGQLGDGTRTARLTPVDVVGPPAGVVAVAAGELHTCGVTSTGAVKCWGDNSAGQLGDGKTRSEPTPVSVVGLASGVAAVAAGASHSCAVAIDGQVWCWGLNLSHQLGDGVGFPGTVTASVAPVAVQGLVDGAVAVAAGRDHTCALTTRGALQCWGNNQFGQLGDGTRNESWGAVLAVGMPDGVTAVATGDQHTCAVTRENTLLCWGDNTFGQLGSRTTTYYRAIPAPVLGLPGGVVAVAAGGGRVCDRFGSKVHCTEVAHTCAVTTAGAVWCWGDNSSGQLGDGTTEHRMAPVAVLGLGSGVTAVAASGMRTCALLRDGSVQCWGANFAGRLGPTPVPGLTAGVASLSVGGHSCIVTTTGAAQCWGGNSSGQLGDGTVTARTIPAPVVGMVDGVVAVAAGLSHSCALTTAGGVRCWGGNFDGQLGHGQTRPASSSIPVGVLGFGTGSQGFFAEGSLSSFFGTRFALVNPGALTANARFEFRRADGIRLSHIVAVPPRTRRTVEAADVIGPSSAEFATTFASDEPLVVDRTIRWGDAAFGSYGGHAERSIPSPAPRWYLAEGSTVGGFNLFYLLQNPNAEEVTVRVRYLRPTGEPLVKDYMLPPRSRVNIWVNLEEFSGVGRALAATDVSAAIESVGEHPIVVERAMYLDLAGQLFGAGHASAGVTAPATQWFLAEGATGPFFDLFVLIANPGDTAASIEATFLLPSGVTVVRTYTVAAATRFNIWVDREAEALADTAVSTSIRSVNDVPIIVERAMWWPGSFGHWYEAHASAGATTTGTRWALAEGEAGGPLGVVTYILLANTSPEPGTAMITLLFEDGTTAQRMFPLAGLSRFNVDVATEFPAAANRRFGAIVESVGETPAPIVVERAMYWDAAGQRWAAGTNASGTRLQ
jgi:alpha-tubulin suppressor-like RCC1 family protein